MTSDPNKRPGPTPVPPRGRGGERKNRPHPRRPVGNRPALNKARPADNRRAALATRHRRHQMSLVGGAIVVVVAVVAILIGINLSGGGGTKTITTTAPVTAAQLDRLTSGVSVAEMRAAATNLGLTSVSGEGAAYPAVTSDPPLTTTGKPEILYIGAEFCPFCATERWPLVLALSKFGTFHDLTAIHSAGGQEMYPDTPTFSFYKSIYTSPYLTFTPVETQTVTHAPLQTPTKAQEAILTKYAIAGQDIPLVYFNGKAIITGAEINPGLLGSGENGPPSKMTFQQLADSISGGTSTLSSNVVADAGVIVSDVCHMTGGKPADVCSLFPQPITS